MNSYLAPRMSSFIVAKLRNSPAITCTGRLKSEHSASPSTSPRINQRFLKDNGVNEETELVLEFVYLAPNKDSANSLNAALENYESSVRSEGMLRKKWFVDGDSHPTAVSKETLAQWLDFIVALGWEHDCEFDGFGASMPDNR